MSIKPKDTVWVKQFKQLGIVRAVSPRTGDLSVKLADGTLYNGVKPYDVEKKNPHVELLGVQHG